MNHSSVDDLGIIPISHHIINQTGITNLCNCCNIFAGCVHVVVASYILWLSHKTELCVVCLAMFLWICDMVGLLRKTFHVMVFSPNRVPWLWHAIAVSLPHQAPYGQLTPSDCVFVCILPLIITKHNYRRRTYTVKYLEESVYAYCALLCFHRYNFPCPWKFCITIFS